MLIEIDEGSGFCFGVTTAIKKAEEELAKSESLYCLGDIVHNGREVERLKKMGLMTVGHADLDTLHDTKMMLRAHGEPPQTYTKAKEQNITLIDATCPVVLNLQRRIRKAYEEGGQIVIYGKNGHAEVVGLVGQTDGTAIVIENLEDAKKLDFSHDIQLFSQTTKSLEGFREIVRYIEENIQEGAQFNYFDTICRRVANRIPSIRNFATQHDVIIFVCGKKSSNGKVLYNECLSVNPHTYMIDAPAEIEHQWFEGVKSVGICGATSTPKWLMEECKKKIENHEEAGLRTH
ncbi:MAG: 4-hydroxy-3-methylbut-2-enyl diphosphate reductase [Bacteroidaceae bacterium]|jgi:4-hydroxy-3-methylbut-2-enyl diphosphate reductase|nr:4-hydroxy-3-methylbut-2-enyl diphosphate reductase [Bacteroidaceae bacterium]